VFLLIRGEELVVGKADGKKTKTPPKENKTNPTKHPHIM
jgi:hypothetical protein